MSSNLVRWGVLGTLLAGISWIASVIVDSVMVRQGPVLAMYTLAWAGTLGGLVGLHGRQAPRYGWLGTTGFFAAFTGAALALAGSVLTFLSRSSILEQEFLDQALGLGLFSTLVGLVLSSAGFVILGVATLRARVMPRWCGVVLILGLPVLWALGGYGGGIVLGIVWLALGYALWSGRSEVVQQNTGVS